MFCSTFALTYSFTTRTPWLMTEIRKPKPTMKISRR